MNKLVKGALSCFIIYACGSYYQFPSLSVFVFGVSRWKWIYSTGIVQNNDILWFPTLKSVFLWVLALLSFANRGRENLYKALSNDYYFKDVEKETRTKCLCSDGSYELPIGPNIFSHIFELHRLSCSFFYDWFLPFCLMMHFRSGTSTRRRGYLQFASMWWE